MPRKSKETLKKKQEETLERMKDTRKEDSVYLRSVVKSKLKWAEEEKKKGEDLIKQYSTAIESLETKVLKLEGYVLALNQLLVSDKKEDKDVDSSN